LTAFIVQQLILVQDVEFVYGIEDFEVAIGGREARSWV
jgi:hypothetical protein